MKDFGRVGRIDTYSSRHEHSPGGRGSILAWRGGGGAVLVGKLVEAAQNFLLVFAFFRIFHHYKQFV